MAHPYQAHRQTKVEHDRVGEITKGYATGGATNHQSATTRHDSPRLAKGNPFNKLGSMKRSNDDDGDTTSRQRPDRSGRARGGRAPKKSGTTVNVIVAPKGDDAGVPPMAPGAVGSPLPPAPPRPPIVAPPPMGGPGLPPGPMGAGPPGAPPGLPIRAHGGRTYAKGGAVKPGPAYEEGRRLGTQVSHSPGKGDLGDMNRPKPITYAKGGGVGRKRAEGGSVGGQKPPRPLPPAPDYSGSMGRGEEFVKNLIKESAKGKATGGPVEAPAGKKGMGPKFHGGGRGGLARLEKAHRAARG